MTVEERVPPRSSFLRWLTLFRGSVLEELELLQSKQRQFQVDVLYVFVKLNSVCLLTLSHGSFY